ARLHEVLVEVALGGVHGDVGDPDLLERFDRLAAGMAQDLADLEVLEVGVPAGEGGDLHQFLPRPSRRSEMMRFWISDVPSKILVSRASRQWRSTACKVVWPAPPWICRPSVPTCSAISEANSLAIDASLSQRWPVSICSHTK